MGRRLIATVGAALLLAACTGGSSEVHALASEVSVQAREVPSGLTRCPGSGGIGGYLKAAKAPTPAAFGRANAEWMSLLSEGAVDGALAIFGDNQASCGSDQLGMLPKARVVSSLVARFKNDEAARRAWQKGFFGLRAPAQGRGEDGLTQGLVTGLGIDSWSFDQQVEGEDVHLSVWEHGPFALFLIVENLPAAQAQEIATAMEGRAG